MPRREPPPNEDDDIEEQDETPRRAAGHRRGGFGHGIPNFGRARLIPIRGGGDYDGDDDMLSDMDDHRHGGHFLDSVSFGAR